MMRTHCEWNTAWNVSQSPATTFLAAGRLNDAERFIEGLSSGRALLIRSGIAIGRGDFAAARNLIIEAEAMLDSRSVSMIDRMLLANQVADLALCTRDPSLLARYDALDRSSKSPAVVAPARLYVDAARLLAEGDIDTAARLLEKAPEGGFLAWRLLVLRAQIASALGRDDDARAIAEDLIARCAAMRCPSYTAGAHIVIGDSLGPKHLDAALEHLHAALVSADEHGLVLVKIESLESLGMLLSETSRAKEGLRMLGAAAKARAQHGYCYRLAARESLFTRAVKKHGESEYWREGSELDLDRACEIARRMRGERTRSTEGWNSLTPTERLVVDQIVRGDTNPQIAEALLMARSTVKTHLLHIYAKLGVRTRAELAAAASIEALKTSGGQR